MKIETFNVGDLIRLRNRTVQGQFVGFILSLHAVAELNDRWGRILFLWQDNAKNGVTEKRYLAACEKVV